MKIETEVKISLEESQLDRVVDTFQKQYGGVKGDPFHQVTHHFS